MHGGMCSSADGSHKPHLLEAGREVDDAGEHDGLEQQIEKLDRHLQQAVSIGHPAHAKGITGQAKINKPPLDNVNSIWHVTAGQLST